VSDSKDGKPKCYEITTAVLVTCRKKDNKVNEVVVFGLNCTTMSSTVSVAVPICRSSGKLHTFCATVDAALEKTLAAKGRFCLVLTPSGGSAEVQQQQMNFVANLSLLEWREAWIPFLQRNL